MSEEEARKLIDTISKEEFPYAMAIAKAYEKLQQENQQLKDNWNKLKEWVNRYYDYYMNSEDFIGGRLCFTDIKNKMQEIEER